MIKKTLIDFHILKCLRKADRVLLLLTSSNWLVLDLPPSSIICVNFFVVIFFPITEQQVYQSGTKHLLEHSDNHLITLLSSSLGFPVFETLSH